MANCPDNLLFAPSHEWLGLQGDTATIGISEFACEQLGDLVFVELPEVGSNVQKGDSVATVESVKTAADIYTPASGTICEINHKLVESPELLNTAPYTEAWLFKLTVSDKTQLEALLPTAKYFADCVTAD
jgi:glycine cleavage system H protein